MTSHKVLGTCQACVGAYALRPAPRPSEGLVLAPHGFTRSGHLGGCIGAGQPPYELSVAFSRLWRSNLALVELVSLEARKRELAEFEEIEVVVAAIARPAPGGRRRVVFRRGHAVRDPDAAGFARTFDEAKRYLVASVAFQIRELQHLIASLDARIDRWRPAPEKIAVGERARPAVR